MEITEYLKYIEDSLKLISKNEVDNFVEALLDAYENNKMIFIIGNGGSSAIASHFAQDLAKGVIPDINEEKRFKALSLTDNAPYITAVANDDGYENIFTSQLKTYSSEGDLLIIISGSGNSPNVVHSAKYAKAKKMKLACITGFDGGEIKKLSDLSIHINMPDYCSVESIHTIILHYVILYLKEKLAKTK